jgi:hypothetical protein
MRARLIAGLVGAALIVGCSPTIDPPPTCRDLVRDWTNDAKFLESVRAHATDPSATDPYSERGAKITSEEASDMHAAEQALRRDRAIAIAAGCVQSPSA